MLINFDEIVNKYGLPKGIIHIGAHLMEERETYLNHGLDNTIWVEANPEIYSEIKHINNDSKELVYNYIISDKDGEIYDFNITNNGQSSSILALDKHKLHHPHIFVKEIISLKSKRMDTLLFENNINIKIYDFLNIDIQGAELLALKGFGNLLKEIKFIYTEVNINSIYKDCALMYEIDEYLNSFGFKRVETEMTNYEWGDALYIKNN